MPVDVMWVNDTSWLADLLTHAMVLRHKIRMAMTIFLCLSESKCQAHVACDSGRGHCRDQCNSWEKEAHGKCGAFCKCCVAEVEGEDPRGFLEWFRVLDHISHIFIPGWHISSSV